MCLSDVDGEHVRELPIMCAVTDFCLHDYDVILPVAVVCNLQAMAVVNRELYNRPTVRAFCQGQPRVNWTTADRLSSETKMGTTILSKPTSSHTNSKPKRNLVWYVSLGTHCFDALYSMCCTVGLHCTIFYN